MGREGVCALQTNTHSQAKARFVGIAHFVCTVTDVLVGHQLPVRAPRFQRPCLWHTVVKPGLQSILSLNDFPVYNRSVAHHHAHQTDALQRCGDAFA